MKHIIGTLLLIIIGFTSCEGRKTQNQALAESIEKFKNEVTIEVKTYTPEHYIENEVDSLLSNGFKVKIKTYSDMENTVLFTNIKDTINYQTHYRNFKFNIHVEKDNKEIYSEHFDKLKINELLGYSTIINPQSQLISFDEFAVLKAIEVNYELSNANALYIDLGYALPNKDFIDWHRIMIDKKGFASFQNNTEK